MKKNNKGFTLVELLGVIVVLAIIIGIAAPAYGRIKDSIDIKNYQNNLELIKVAASKYYEDANIKAAYVKDLIEAGYLDEKTFSKLINPKNNESIQCYLVKINEENGSTYASVIEKMEVLSDGQCDPNAKYYLNNDITITAYELETNNLITKTNDYWTNKNVKLIYKIIDENGLQESQIVSRQWEADYEIITENDNYELRDNGKVLIIKNQDLLEKVYTLKITTIDGKKYDASYYVRIDKIPPKINDGTFSPSKNVWSKEKKYKINASDSHSGVYQYAFIAPTADCNTTTEYKAIKEKIFNKIQDIKICVKDKAGNISGKNESIDNIDNTTIACAFETTAAIEGETVGSVKWYKSNVTVKLKATKIGPSGVYLGINPNDDTAKYENKPLYTEDEAFLTTNLTTDVKNKTYYGFIKNRSGNTGKCNKTIGLEKSITAPKCKSSEVTSDSVKLKDCSAGNAISGIKETKCYRTDINGNNRVAGTLESDGSCTFKKLPNGQIFYFTKCIKSYAGNEKCADITTVDLCGSGNYNTSEGTCSATCPDYCDYAGGTATGTRTDTYTSKYQNLSCGSKSNIDCSKSCAKTIGCCDEGNYDVSYGDCSATCPTYCDYAGGTATGSKSGPSTSKYVDVSGNKKSCGIKTAICSISCDKTVECCSSYTTTTKACNAVCPTACGTNNSGANATGVQTDEYTSSYKNSSGNYQSCGSNDKVSCSISCKATSPCYTAVTFEWQNIGFNNTTAGSGAILGYSKDKWKLSDYSRLEYKLVFSKIEPAGANCYLEVSNVGNFNNAANTLGLGADNNVFEKHNTIFTTPSLSISTTSIVEYLSGVAAQKKTTWAGSKDLSNATGQSTVKNYIRVVCTGGNTGTSGGNMNISSGTIKLYK